MSTTEPDGGIHLDDPSIDPDKFDHTEGEEDSGG